MKKLLGIFFLLVAGFVFAPTPSALAQTAGSTINITSPLGGACYKGGNQVSITWTTDQQTTHHAYISYHGGDSNNPIFSTFTNIPGGHPTTGLSLNWTTPLITASDIKIYAEAHTASHARIGAGVFSGTFSIDSSGPSAPALARRCVFPACGGAVASNIIEWSFSTDPGCKGLTGYEVFRDGEHIGYTQENSFIDTNIAAGTTYEYKVSAYDDFTFTNSNVISVTTGAAPQTPPPAPPSPTESTTPPASPSNPTLKITKKGNGDGTVTSVGINCGGDCEQQHPSGTVVNLNATADANSKFTGWTGDCLGIGMYTCQTTVSASKTVSATFTKVKLYTLTLKKIGSGNGAVSSSMSGINCGDVCSTLYKEDAVVFLNAEEDSTSEFKGWTGDCLGIGSRTCQTTMANSKTITANFAAVKMFTLTIKKAGEGSGTVAGNNIDCGSQCAGSFKEGALVALHATADSDNEFEYWTGDCLGVGSGVCQTTMESDKTITFFFKSSKPTPIVYKIGGGLAAAAGLAFLLWRLFGRNIGRPKYE